MNCSDQQTPSENIDFIGIPMVISSHIPSTRKAQLAVLRFQNTGLQEYFPRQRSKKLPVLATWLGLRSKAITGSPIA